jgi:hypothetical protein
VGILHHFSSDRDILSDPAGERVRRGSRGPEAQLVEIGFNIRQAHNFGELLLQQRDNLGRWYKKPSGGIGKFCANDGGTAKIGGRDCVSIGADQILAQEPLIFHFGHAIEIRRYLHDAGAIKDDDLISTVGYKVLPLEPLQRLSDARPPYSQHQRQEFMS